MSVKIWLLLTIKVVNKDIKAKENFVYNQFHNISGFFFMVIQILHSPQAKRSVIINDKHDRYELPREL